jgi:hypothetical protein
MRVTAKMRNRTLGMHIWNVDAVTGLISAEVSEERLGKKGKKEEGGCPR